MTHFNQLTPAQAERLAILAEECGETVQAIGKILRHGYDSVNPDDPIHAGNRSHQLEQEIGNIFAAVELLVNGGDVRDWRISASYEDKRAKGFITHHQ